MIGEGTEVIMSKTPLQPNVRPNPYVGPRPFTEEEKLYGRESEIQNLMNLFIAERILLLHSPSGAGKTSLIQAGLVPRLRGQKIGKDSRKIEKFCVRPVIRVNQEPSVKIKKSPAYNRYIFSMLSSFESAFDKKEDQIPDDELVSMSLSDYLKRRVKPKNVLYDIFIFDQFEEILTLDPTDLEAKREFFKQLGKILEDRTRWALFVIREDYLASFEPYLFLIPTRFSNRFRLDFLGTEAACQAIQAPVRQVGVVFTDKAANQLVNNLRQVKIQSPDGSMTEQLGPYVEPVQLQVVCFRLWQNLASDDQKIDENDLIAVGDVNQSLADYYAEQVSAVANKLKIEEIVIRKWFDNKLITAGGIRSQVLMDVDVSEGLLNQAIFQFVDAHLVRAEKRRGLTWFELAHDRLVEPVRKDNKTWFESNLSPLQRQAALWKDGRRSDYLLYGKALEDAREWAEAHDEILSTEEREFLDACLAAQAVEEAERRAKAMRLRQIIVASVLVSVIMALAALFSSFQWQTAEEARQYAEDALVTATNAQGYAQQQGSTAEAALNFIETLVANPAVAQKTNVAQATEPLDVVIGDVHINGGDDRETVIPGQQLSVTIEYSIQDEGCPYCFDVIQIGFSDSAPLQCIYQGVPGFDGVSNTVEVKIDVPATLGGYSLIIDSAREYSCPVEWRSDLPTDLDRRIAKIDVKDELLRDSKNVPMIFIPAGEFTMGNDTSGDVYSRPAHTVYVEEFYIDQYEVTNEMYDACEYAGGCRTPRYQGSVTRSTYYGEPGFANYPAIYLDWSMAKAYCEWRGARLPTEAEWEKAARGTDERIYPWGDSNLNCSLANYYGCPEEDTAPVDKHDAGQSPYGIYGMAGNVWEWTSTLFEYYPYNSTDGREDPGASGDRVARGGSWEYLVNAANVRADTRIGFNPATFQGYLGVRCARSIEQFSPPTHTVSHTLMPPSLVKTGELIYDVVSEEFAAEKRTLYGDSYDLNLLERPFTMDMIYVPDIDIAGYSLGWDEKFYYVSIALVGANPNNEIGIQYGVELDLADDGFDGFGDYIVIARPPYSEEWSTDNVQVAKDTNDDTGGDSAERSDAPLPGNGYDTVIFGEDVGDDPDLAWVRVNAGKDATVQFAFKRALAGNRFMFGVIADGGLKEIGDLDYVDRFTESEAGSPISDNDNPNYPLKALYAVDNTCWTAQGFEGNWEEPKRCPKK
ncbi:MAG: SUMF1/EgtB/PvdO family nonheme iron enzyme [Chloroflexota bacterium]